MQANGGPPPHQHRHEDEAFYILEGTLKFYTSDASFEATAGELVHLPRGHKHWFKNDSGQVAKALVMVFPGGLEEMFKTTGTIVNHVSEPILGVTKEEKQRLLEITPDYGISIEIPSEESRL